MLGRQMVGFVLANCMQRNCLAIVFLPYLEVEDLGQAGRTTQKAWEEGWWGCGGRRWREGVLVPNPPGLAPESMSHPLTLGISLPAPSSCPCSSWLGWREGVFSSFRRFQCHPEPVLIGVGAVVC